MMENICYSGDTIYEVCSIDTNAYEHKLNYVNNILVQHMCHLVACLYDKSIPNKWANTVMDKLSCAGITIPQELKVFTINKTLNQRLKNFGDSGFNPTTWK